MRIFALSDIHVDYSENNCWVKSLSLFDYSDDVLILAGDVSHIDAQVERCAGQLVRRFRKVLFVPGNHDLWVTCGETKRGSLEKFHRFCEIVQQSGASITPYHQGNLSIVPLFGWYDFSFGLPGAELAGSWMDFLACRWPNDWTVTDVTSHFLQMNTYQRRDDKEIIISFSHFLPRIDLASQLASTKYRYLLPVLGSTRLGNKISQLRSAIHVYGHSHRNRKVELDGTIYVNNAFGYPNERHIAAKQLHCIYGW